MLNLPSASIDAIEKSQAPDAQIVVWSENGWCALAREKDGAAIGIGWGGTSAQARLRALADCRKRAAPDAECRLATIVYSGKPAYVGDDDDDERDEAGKRVKGSKDQDRDDKSSKVWDGNAGSSNGSSISAGGTGKSSGGAPKVWFDGQRTRFGDK
jgi:hypothetical protein